jgi:hypothetical protein
MARFKPTGTWSPLAMRRTCAGTRDLCRRALEPTYADVFFLCAAVIAFGLALMMTKRFLRTGSAVAAVIAGVRCGGPAESGSQQTTLGQAARPQALNTMESAHGADARTKPLAGSASLRLTRLHAPISRPYAHGVRLTGPLLFLSRPPAPAVWEWPCSMRGRCRPLALSRIRRGRRRGSTTEAAARAGAVRLGTCMGQSGVRARCRVRTASTAARGPLGARS